LFFLKSFDIFTPKKSRLVKYTNKQKKSTTKMNKQTRLREKIKFYALMQSLPFDDQWIINKDFY